MSIRDLLARITHGNNPPTKEKETDREDGETGANTETEEAVREEASINAGTAVPSSGDDERIRAGLRYVSPEADEAEVWASIQNILPLRLRNMMDYLIEKTPEGNCPGIHYCIGNTQYVVTLYLFPSDKNDPDGEWRFRVGVSLKGYSIEFTNYLRKGSWLQLAEYLKTDDAVNVALNSAMQLIQRVDKEDFDDSGIYRR